MDSDYYASGIFPLVTLVVLNFWLVALMVAAVVQTFQVIRAERRGGSDDREK